MALRREDGIQLTPVVSTAAHRGGIDIPGQSRHLASLHTFEKIGGTR
jgi:hypothetical protein